MKQETTLWEATKTPGLYIRRPGAAFYARIILNGKRTFRSLKTDKLKVALQLLRDLQNGHTKQVSSRSDDKLHAAMDKVIEFRQSRRALKSRGLKKSTVGFHTDILGVAKRLFPDRPLAEFELSALLNILVASGYSQSRRKALFELLKRTFADGVENGTIKRNPLHGQIPGKVGKKDRVLPTRAQLEDIMKVIPEVEPRYGHRAVFTLRFLAFSGMRIDEAKNVQWSDIADGKIAIRGGVEGTKTLDIGQARVMDINAPLQAVLDDIGAFYGTDGRVMPAKSILPHLRAACAKLKIPPVNHHDLRAWFITWGITSGVDVSTLAGWVGNSPTVLLERYASVQDELKRTAAAKLS